MLNRFDFLPSRFCFFILAVMSLSVTACSGVTTTPLKETSGDYILGVGDTVGIIVYGQEELTGEFKIEPDGSLSLPLIDDVAASGRTANQVEAAIYDALDPELLVNPKVSVDVVMFRDMYILGEVQQPGKYEYAPNLTVLQAVAMAGGYTYRASESSAEVTRHVRGALKTFTVDQKTMLKPGDTVVVKRRWF